MENGKHNKNKRGKRMKDVNFYKKKKKIEREIKKNRF